MSKKDLLKGSLCFVLAFLIFSLVLNLLIPKSRSQLKASDFLNQEKVHINYIAIGDSLTEGVGDSTNQGGFIPLLSKDLESHYHVTVNAQNYGISGNTSQQIVKRMQNDEALKSDLKKAQIMTLTVGGNDVMAVIRKHLSHLEIETFDQPMTEYQERLSQIITLAKKANKDIRIYVLGIYNPFYLNFPEITKMQDVVNNWNHRTKITLSQFKYVHFVPINDQLYKGIDGKEGIVHSEGDKKSVLNDVLYAGDHFHPNNIGYQIMSDAVLEAIKKHEKKLKH
ncbi:SGNH/GDSL hydrolase family protein [Streptococcus porcinus]|uniref:GDSL-like protein n=1 Tax=Streptococcus porcinus str. Jelinkova 176 TaxID=873448 RepID=A0ABN0CUN6_STRPO|nr:SGNH/GDSL hydrolase family protein [Streptococcus porcinus]EGJ27000.1 GDSL-like protein [Streptococcus porcinus str. Jelinkova 176]SQG43271.1 lipase/acylhydrolase with GDSL-like motif [Streptococcus porcinus]